MEHLKNLISIILVLLISTSWSYAQTADELLRVGIEKYNKAEYIDAITNFTKSIELDSNNSVTYYYRGLSKFFQKDYLWSIEDLSTSIVLDSNNYEAFNYRGLAKYELRKSNYVHINYYCVWDAINDFNSAIGLNPKYILANENKAIALNNVSKQYNVSEQYMRYSFCSLLFISYVSNDNNLKILCGPRDGFKNYKTYLTPLFESIDQYSSQVFLNNFLGIYNEQRPFMIGY